MAKGKLARRWRLSDSNSKILLFESEPGLWTVDIDTPDYSDYRNGGLGNP
jgi:hypothetical protein